MMTAKQAKDMVNEATRAATRSGKTDKAKGYTKRVVGSIRAGNGSMIGNLGSMIGNEEMEAKRRMQNVSGKKDRSNGDIHEITEAVGNLLKIDRKL